MRYKFTLTTIVTALSLVSAVAYCEDKDAAQNESRARFDSSSSQVAIEMRRLDKRVSEAKEIFDNLLNSSDGGVPQKLLSDTQCIGVLPGVLKAAFILGGEYGSGVLSCKTKSGNWSAPAFIQLGAASLGWQIGGESTDLVLFFAGEQSEKVLSSSKFTLGGDIGISAGPVGRSAEANLGPHQKGVFSYAHSQGIYAGLALKGAVLNPDVKANSRYYGRSDVSSFILDKVQLESMPKAAKEFVAALP